MNIKEDFLSWQFSCHFQEDLLLDVSSRWHNAESLPKHLGFQIPAQSPSVEKKFLISPLKGATHSIDE